MASPIPTQLSPGIKVSEVDLSQFVQPQAINSAGMVGIFNWGPQLVAYPVTSESELAGIFGKPTLDPSDTSTEDDFLAASNFLRYSSNLKVVRAAQAGDASATTTEAGITGISSCNNRTIKNEEEFRSLGGFSNPNGIENKSIFRAKFPGNFGNSLKVVAYDGMTSSSYIDYTLGFGYVSGTTGIETGTIGYTFSAEYISSVNSDGSPVYSSGITSNSSLKFVKVTLLTGGIPAREFIDRLSDANGFNILYASGSTSNNTSLTGTGSNPSGNAINYHAVEDATLGDGTKFNPFRKYHNGSNPQFSPKKIFAKPNPLYPSDAVDILLLDGDYSNMNYDYRVGNTFNGSGSKITRLFNFQHNGVPSHFGDLIFTETLFDLYRNTWSRVYKDMFGSDRVGTPGEHNAGWAVLVGITGGVSFAKTVDGVQISTTGITFDALSTATGIRNDFVSGIKQFGRSTASTSVETKENYSNIRIFDKIPDTSEYAINSGGSNDEISIAIIDTAGKFGPKNSILEKFELLSKAVDAKNLNGESIYYKDYINTNSKYVYVTKPFAYVGNAGSTSSDSATAFGDIVSQYVASDGVTYTMSGYYESQMKHGVSSVSDATVNEKMAAYSLFANDSSNVDILFIQESSNANDTATSAAVLERQVYDTVIEPRKDTLLVIPTPKPANFSQHSAQATSNAINYRKNLINVPSNSYTILVAGRKLYFDTYNNQIRRMSLASDIAGILSAQEVPWESPAGFVRGNLKNAIRLETNFSKENRDELYKNQINFFVQFNDGTGTALFGDKTLLTKPSAFDRINVRRVFISAEKAIAQAAKYSLFEFNDEFTRSQFRNLVNPFLATLQSQRGITDFRVVCDETNNTQEVIDNNQFVADIYIKPNKSINFIQLNFIATRSDFNLTTIE